MVTPDDPQACEDAGEQQASINDQKPSVPRRDGDMLATEAVLVALADTNAMTKLREDQSAT